jgi:hypothetical protein
MRVRVSFFMIIKCVLTNARYVPNVTKAFLLRNFVG